MDACIEIRSNQGGCKVGEAVITTAGNLPAKYVIHTVGPVWNGGGSKEEEKLRNAYLNSLKLAVANDVRSIAFPGISTGIYHFPKGKAAEIVVNTVVKFLETHEPVWKVIFVVFDYENLEIYQQVIASLA